jgi:transcriptional regulator with XRE-family HTH domain
MRLGKIVRRWRNAAEIPLRDVALEIGIAPSTLVHMEMGKIPPHSETLIKIIVWLLSDEPEVTNEVGADQRTTGIADAQSGDETATGKEE